MRDLPTEPDFDLVADFGLEAILQAAERLSGHAHRTPVFTSSALDAAARATVLLKCENLQRVGAFKFRGAFNAIAELPPGTPGVLAYSSGNHAQAVALASAMLGHRAVIVMPENAPSIKLRATRAYLEPGGIADSEVVTYDPGSESREAIGVRLAEQHGLTIVPPYDHPDVIAGQGTAALELIEDHGPLDALFVCVGGGGLLSGCAVAAKALNPACRVIGIEPALADDAARSFRDRTLHTVHNPPTIADGARTPCLGRHTFPLVLTHADEIRTVTERQIRDAMRFAFERLKLVVEPAGALALAGVLAQQPEMQNPRIGVILSGGNVDPAAFSSIVTGDTP